MRACVLCFLLLCVLRSCLLCVLHLLDMPPVRRRSTPPPSVAPYTLPSPSPPRAFTFAPNVAAESFNEPPPLIVPQESTLFPSADPASVSRKPSHARKKPDDWIPRPPNAFILFRSEVRSARTDTGCITHSPGSLSRVSMFRVM